MKNLFSHVEILAPLHLLRSWLFQMSSNVEIKSKSMKYFGLANYVHALCSIEISKSAKVKIQNYGFLVFGTDTSSFRGWAGRTKLVMRPSSKLVVNDEYWVGRGSKIWLLENGVLEFNGPGSFCAGNNLIICKSNVYIGARTQIAWGVTIMDHDFHQILDSDGFPRPETAPIRIEDDVWIGADAKILKGVTIGRGAVVASSSVVTRDVPEHTLVAGNPAKIIRRNVFIDG